MATPTDPRMIQEIIRDERFWKTNAAGWTSQFTDKTIRSAPDSPYGGLRAPSRLILPASE